LGLAYLGAYLRDRGVAISIIDAKFEKLNIKQVVERARKIAPDIVGITVMTNYVKAGALLAQRIRQVLPRSIFVAGGAHPTALAADTLKEFSVFDIVVIGEGEEALFEIASAKAGQWPDILGIAYKMDGQVRQNSLRPRIENLDALPFPAWEMFPRAKTYPLITSRGCPFRCIFCMRMHGVRVRLRSPDNVAQEMKMLAEKYHIRRLPILDEIFTVNKERVFAICDFIEKEGLQKKLAWAANSRVTGTSYEIFKKMRNAGCRKIDFGIESGNDDTLRLIQKDATVEDAVRAVGLAKKAGLRTHGLFILGHPNETRKSAGDTIKLAVRLNTAYLSVGIMVPYPGTQVYDMARAGLGGYRLISRDWNDYNKQIGNALELKGLDRRALERLQISAYLKFYLYNFRVIDCIKFLFSYRRVALFYLRNKARALICP